jgi:hypothetical protein
VGEETERARRAEQETGDTARRVAELTVELDAARRAVAAGGDTFQKRLEAADERIKELELQLFGRDRGAPDADIDLASMLEAPAAAADQPIRRFSRYTFRSTLPVTVGDEAAVLVDLSVGGAQVLSENPLELELEAPVSLISSEIPVTCRGRIVWSRADPQSRGKSLRYRAGVLFTDADPAAVEAFIIRYSGT